MKAPVREAEESIVRLQRVAAFEWLGEYSRVVSVKYMAHARGTSEGVLEDQSRSWSCCQVARSSENGEDALGAGDEIELYV